MILTHIWYVDVCKAEKEQKVFNFFSRRISIVFKRVMLSLDAVSGLRITLAKSSMFSINAEDCIEDLANISSCEVD